MRKNDGEPASCAFRLPPQESLVSSTEFGTEYTMAIISPPARNFLNFAFVNVESLRNIEGERQTHYGAEFVMAIVHESITTADRTL